MFAVTGITGRVGGVVARGLLDAGLSVRAVVRDAAKGVGWKECGCEVALAEMNDAPALSAAFTRVSGVFVLIPPIFDPAPGFREVRAVITALTTAMDAAKLPKVVCLSTIGAQATQPNLLSQLGLVERALGALPTPDLLPAGGLVHGECGLGRRTGAGPGRRAELSAAARQARADGRDG